MEKRKWQPAWRAWQKRRVAAVTDALTGVEVTDLYAKIEILRKMKDESVVLAWTVPIDGSATWVAQPGMEIHTSDHKRKLVRVSVFTEVVEF